MSLQRCRKGPNKNFLVHGGGEKELNCLIPVNVCLNRRRNCTPTSSQSYSRRQEGSTLAPRAFISRNESHPFIDHRFFIATAFSLM